MKSNFNDHSYMFVSKNIQIHTLNNSKVVNAHIPNTDCDRYYIIKVSPCPFINAI